MSEHAAELGASLAQLDSAALAHCAASAQGAYREANRNARTIARTYRKIRACGPAGDQALLDLMGRAAPGVQGWVASYVLEFAPSAAEAVLEELARMDDLIGFSAQMTLREWRRGALRFP